MLKATHAVFEQLFVLVDSLTDEDYYKKSPSLSNATIGQHVRHVVEFYQCLSESCITGQLNYDNRQRNLFIEENRLFGISCIQKIKSDVEKLNLKKLLVMESDYSYGEVIDTHFVETSVARELVYNIEHAVHHMALIKIAVCEVAPYITLPPSFGVAVSTIKHQEQCAR
jgi:hypothetical protein